MTTSEIRSGLNDVSHAIRTERQALMVSAARFVTAEANLNSLPTVHAALVDAINNTPAEELPAGAKEDLALLVSEFQSLRTKAADAKNAISAIDFTT